MGGPRLTPFEMITLTLSWYPRPLPRCPIMD